MPFARRLDPATSHQAAASVTITTLTEIKNEILNQLNKQPLCDHELVNLIQAKKFAASPSGIRSRRAELTRQGLVLDSGDRLKLPSGRKAIVWKRA